MSDISVKHRKMYVDHPKDISKHTCLIHGPGNSSYEFKVLGDFGSKQSKFSPNKERGHEPATKKKFNIHQDNNTVVNYVVDEIILDENNKVSAEDESHEIIYSKIYENDIYMRLTILVLTKIEKIKNDTSVRLKANSKKITLLKSIIV